MISVKCTPAMHTGWRGPFKKLQFGWTNWLASCGKRPICVKKKCFQKYPNSCGRGLSQSYKNYYETKQVFTWENSHQGEFHTGMTFWFRVAFTWWWVISYLGYLKVHFMLIKYTCDSKSQTLRMHYPFQSTCCPISHRNGWSFRVYMIPMRNFALEWNSRSGTTNGVTSRRCDSRWHDILWWYHVNKGKAMGGNRSELAPAQKSPVSCNHPLMFCSPISLETVFPD